MLRLNRFIITFVTRAVVHDDTITYQGLDYTHCRIIDVSGMGFDFLGMGREL